MESREWEEDVHLVVELSEVADAEYIKRCKSYVLEDIDTIHPTLRLDSNTFHGTYEDTVGTDIIFEPSPPDSGPAEASFPKHFKQKCLSTKRLRFDIDVSHLSAVDQKQRSPVIAPSRPDSAEHQSTADPLPSASAPGGPADSSPNRTLQTVDKNGTEYGTTTTTTTPTTTTSFTTTRTALGANDCDKGSKKRDAPD